MALITCPECERQVSELARSCPSCGYPIEDKRREGVPQVSPPPIPETKDQSGRSEIVLPDQGSDWIELPPEPRISPSEALVVLHQELHRTRSSNRVSGRIWLGLAIIVGGMPVLSMMTRGALSGDAASLLCLPLFLLPVGSYFDLRASIGRRAYASKLGLWLAVFVAALRTNIILILLFGILGHLGAGGSGGGFAAGAGVGTGCAILVVMGQLVTAIGVFLRLRRIERGIGSAIQVSKRNDKNVVAYLVVGTVVILVVVGFLISLSDVLSGVRRGEQSKDQTGVFGKAFTALKEGDPERAKAEYGKAEAAYLQSIEDGAKGVGESAACDRATKQCLDEVIPKKRDYEAKFRAIRDDPKLLDVEWLAKDRNLSTQSDAIASFLRVAKSYNESRDASSKKLDALLREEGVSREYRETLVGSFSESQKGARPFIIASIEWGESASRVLGYLEKHRDQWSYEGETFLYETDKFFDELLRLNQDFDIAAQRTVAEAKRWADSLSKQAP
jgi:hypothetical protein